MDIGALAAGDTLWLEDGSLVAVVNPSTDGENVTIKYVEAPFDQALVGTEAVCSEYDIISYANDSDNASSSAN
jgi:hypothetical protein